MISAFELMENFIKRGHSKDYLFKNQRVNGYLRERYNTNTQMYWSPKYLENTYRELLRNDKCHSRHERLYKACILRRF